MPIILNKDELGTSQLRKDALEVLEAGLEAINTEKVLKRKVRVENGILFIKNNDRETKVELPSPYKNKIIFVGIGKCALDGARVLENILGDYLTEGAVIDVRPTYEAADLHKTRYFVGTHPYPSEQNVLATQEIIRMVENLTENDLVITLISGGGSSLFELPIPEVTLETIVEQTKTLTSRGADIYEMNSVRKSLSQVKGGKFAKIIAPARLVSLIFSDVLGNDVSVIASGPTVIDLGSVSNILIASNHDALTAMKSKAEKLGYATVIETEKLSGNASFVGNELANRLPNPKTCILFGGETTVQLKNHNNTAEPGFKRGKGGRNQELALAALVQIPQNTVLISASSDGWDNTDHAGALADRSLLEKSKQLGIDPQEFLERSDSYNFFKLAGGAISTGRLGSNVSDLCILIYK